MKNTDFKPVGMTIAIELKYSESGIAYAFNSQGRKVYRGAPTALDSSQYKVPTILINDDGSYEFGHAAVAKYEQDMMSRAPSDLPTSQLFQNFIKGPRNPYSGYDNIMVASLHGRRRSLMDVIVKCLITLKDFALDSAALN
jgi:hypothetical protein